MRGIRLVIREAAHEQTTDKLKRLRKTLLRVKKAGETACPTWLQPLTWGWGRRFRLPSDDQQNFSAIRKIDGKSTNCESWFQDI